MDRWQYLLVMAGCLLVTLPLEFVFKARVYRRWRLLLRALLPVVAVFVIWDVVAIASGHWWYSPRYTSGIILPGALPLEELVFFLVIPICGVLTYEAVGTVLSRLRGHSISDPHATILDPTPTIPELDEGSHPEPPPTTPEPSPTIPELVEGSSHPEARLGPEQRPTMADPSSGSRIGWSGSGVGSSGSGSHLAGRADLVALSRREGHKAPSRPGARHA